jgi:acetoin utilization protein AcuB
MSLNPEAAAAEEKLSSIESRMRQGEFHSMPVLEQGKPIGIMSQGDLRHYAGQMEGTTAKAAMANNVVAVSPDTSVSEAGQHLREHDLTSLPVIEEDRVVGMVSVTDLL